MTSMLTDLLRGICLNRIVCCYCCFRYDDAGAVSVPLQLFAGVRERAFLCDWDRVVEAGKSGVSIMMHIEIHRTCV